jgi:hypothetical protein
MPAQQWPVGKADPPKEPGGHKKAVGDQAKWGRFQFLSHFTSHEVVNQTEGNEQETKQEDKQRARGESDQCL